jgi:hypothetical protein
LCPAGRIAIVRPELLKKLGIPIPAQPVFYSDNWFGVRGYFPGSMMPMLPGPTWQEASVEHRIKKVWILPLNLTVGAVTRRGLPVIVKLAWPGVIMLGDQEYMTPANPDRLVIGNSFFAPGTFTLTDNTIEYKGPLSVTVEHPVVTNPSYSGSPMSQQEVARIAAKAEQERKQAEADVAAAQIRSGELACSERVCVKITLAIMTVQAIKCPVQIATHGREPAR